MEFKILKIQDNGRKNTKIAISR